MIQTVVQNLKSVHFGSVQFDISQDGVAWINMGAGKNAAFEETREQRKVKSDNAGEILVGEKPAVCKFTFDAMELDLEKLNTARGGVDTYSTVAAAPVAVTGEAHGTGWTQGQPIQLTNKNGDNTIVTAITVKAGGSALVANTDYRTYVGDGSNGYLGYTYIVPITTQTLAITVDYTYTPLAAKILRSGGKQTINYVKARFTNINEFGKKLQLTIYKGASTAGLKFNFPADDADDPMMTTIEIEGTLDATRTAGDQLFEILDEQGVL